VYTQQLLIRTPVSQMARLVLIASLVGARVAAGLDAAPAESSMMQLGAAVDKSNASQQTGWGEREKVTATIPGLSMGADDQCAWITGHEVKCWGKKHRRYANARTPS
jgi:hypothetical protein